LKENNSFEAAERKSRLDSHFPDISHKIVRWVRLGNDLESGEQVPRQNQFSLSLSSLLKELFQELATYESNATVTTTADEDISLTSKPFIYLTQNEQCLPQYLASPTKIGDSKTCNCDVIVLSYIEKCQDEKPSDITYVFAKESTCTTGQNLLYFVAIERIRHYHYYIFLDDDVHLGFNSFSSQ